MDNKNQLVVFLTGNPGCGKTWIANRLVNKNGYTAKHSFTEILIKIATAPDVFAIPKKYFLEENKNTAFDFPLQVREAHLRKLLKWLSDNIPTTLEINFRKIAISNFAFPMAKTPAMLTQYISTCINQISPEILPALAYLCIVGVPGKFVFEDLTRENQYIEAKEKFQFVYVVGVEPEKKKKDDKIFNIPNVKNFITISKSSSAEDTDKSLEAALELIEEDLALKIKEGDYAPLSKTTAQEAMDYLQRKGPLAQNAIVNKQQAGVLQNGNAIFQKGNPEADTFVPNNKIQFYHDAGAIDRSGLVRK